MNHFSIFMGYYTLIYLRDTLLIGTGWPIGVT